MSEQIEKNGHNIPKSNKLLIRENISPISNKSLINIKDRNLTHKIIDRSLIKELKKKSNFSLNMKSYDNSAIKETIEQEHTHIHDQHSQLKFNKTLSTPFIMTTKMNFENSKEKDEIIKQIFEDPDEYLKTNENVIVGN